MAPGSHDGSMDIRIQIVIGFFVLVLIILLPLWIFPSAFPGAMPASGGDNFVKVRILAVNDFHGQLPSGKSLNHTPVGSSPVLASYLRSEMARDDVSATVLALPGDLVGASPPDSGLLLDEPAILTFNTFADTCCPATSMSCDKKCTVLATFGNHEFDKGVPELLRKLSGGNGSTTIPHLIDPYPGSRTTYVCSNVVWTINATPVAQPYVIREVDGIPIAFIGADTVLTTGLEMPANIEGVSFLNETESINRYVKEVQRTGVHAIVVLLHEGGNQDAYEGFTRTGTNVTGRITGIVAGLDPDVDVILSGHTHNFTNAYLNNSGGKPVLVTQAYSYSVAFSETELTLDPTSREITNKTARIVTTRADRPPGTEPDPAAAAILADADKTVAPLTGRLIATASMDITRNQNAAGECALGDLVADGQRAAMGADVGFITTGSLRADIAKGNVTWGDLYAVQPFYGTVLSMTLTGNQIREVLEQQWGSPMPPHNLAVSGLSYSWDPDKPVGSRVSDIRVGGVPLEPDKNYTAAMPDYLASGGDNYSVFTEGTNVARGPTDIDALAAYIGSLPQPVNGTLDTRIIVR
ncbi:MAG: bifunctional metallophosphatase/5'-nucleotidase [Methanoregulaceae archaeon]